LSSATPTPYSIEPAAPRPLPPKLPLSVNIVDNAYALASLRREWNELADRTTDEPFFRHEFVQTWIENFAPQAPLKILIARDANRRLTAVLPLIEQRIKLSGIPVRLWAAPNNVHSARFDLLADDRELAGRIFGNYLHDTKGWDMLRLSEVPPDARSWQLYDAARRAGCPVGVYESQRSVYIPLPGSYDKLQAELGGKFRGNLRRRRTQLEKRGSITVEHIVGGADLQAKLEECFAIEQSGWKGKRGDAANGDPQIHGFFSTLAQRAARNGSLSLFRLLLDGRPIAFNYGLVQNGVYSLLMTSFDESLRDCSPGHLITEETLKSCISSGHREFDFLGCDLEWKLSWSQTIRQHTWLFIFSDNLRGRLLHSIKFKMTPAAKRLLARWRSTRN
jgi:CelD/BcsL family acetyltransferase involved in cellulose biosynthesis